MQIEISPKQFRRLLDLVYIGNWVLNSARGSDRIPDFDNVESFIFSQCPKFDMSSLCELSDGEIIPSRAFSEGGIHEAIMDYEDSVFFDILAEELSQRDCDIGTIVSDELPLRRECYLNEFLQNGITNISVDAEL